MNVQNKADKSKFAGNMLMLRITMPMPNRDSRNKKKHINKHVQRIHLVNFFPSVLLWVIACVRFSNTLGDCFLFFCLNKNTTRFLSGNHHRKLNKLYRAYGYFQVKTEIRDNTGKVVRGEKQSSNCSTFNFNS